MHKTPYSTGHVFDVTFWNHYNAFGLSSSLFNGGENNVSYILMQNHYNQDVDISKILVQINPLIFSWEDL